MTSFPPLRGRTRELGLLRGGYDAQEASIRWVVGLPGVGKTETVLRAAMDFRFLYHRVPPLSDPHQRLALAETLKALRPDGEADAKDPGHGEPSISDGPAESPPTWEGLFQAMVDAVPDGRTMVVVVDDAHRWVESRARFEPALQESLKKANALGRSIHVTLVAPELTSTRLGEECLLPPLHLAPLSFRGASHFLPGATTRDKLKSYTVFGGLPGVLTLLDSRATLASNFRRLVLAREAPLREAPLTLLERFFQRPNRYAAILTSLASGEGDWSTVQTGVGDLTASGQAGPYLKRLEEVGLVESRRSLDASPRTRSRRYRLTDPFIAYWFRFVLPLRESLAMPLREAGGSTPGDSTGRGGRKGTQAKGCPPEFDSQLASILPEVCRDYMAFDAMEVLGANAREWGSLWGPGYEIPVAGVLRNGTPFYGHVVLSEAPLKTSALTALDAQVRETRFGFGRERRLRILFGGGKVSPALLRQMARRDDAVLVDLDTLGP